MPESDLLKNLNAQQAAAVSARPGPILVVAGPGSGKTAVLTQRVAYLIGELDVNPYNIMAVTFTNKAADEMKTRIEALLHGRSKGLTIGTFHSICARILRREAETLGIKPSYGIYDTTDQLAVMKQAIQDLKLDVEKHTPRRYLSKVSNAKNELIGPYEYPEDNYLDRVVKDIYKRYQDLLRAANAMDFDDLLMFTALLFRDHPDVRERYRRYYPHLLVDEFQDTNVAQYALITLLAGTEPTDLRSVFCVGDPDQSIYRFRGADYRNIGYFQRDYPDAQIILLEQNYRSHQIILDAAMAIIDKNPDRIQKQLTTVRRDGTKLTLRQSASAEEEARYIAQQVLELKYRGAYDLKDCAVMYRTNAQSRSLEETFVRANIPYRLIGGVRFYDRREVKDVLSYLRVIYNPDDMLSLERIINVPRRGIGETAVGKLKAWAQERRQTLYDALQSIEGASETPFSGRTARPLIEFARLIESWRQVKDTQPAAWILNDVLDKTQYKASLSDGTPESIERIENVSELQGMAFSAGDMKLAEFLEEIALVSDVDTYDPKQNSVVLMTLHAAKGLEFPVVFLCGLEENLMPHSMSASDPEQLEEERRLMYVGITRAKDLLYLTWARRRALYGRDDDMQPSRFLEDIPPALTTGSTVARKRDRPFERAQIDPEWSTKWTVPAPPKVPTSRVDRNPWTASRSTTAAWKAGQKVLHQRFGEGVIISSKIRGDDEEIDIKFQGHGIKRLFASSANLVLLED